MRENVISFMTDYVMRGDVMRGDVVSGVSAL